MGTCRLCGLNAQTLMERTGQCADCIRADIPKVRTAMDRRHRERPIPCRLRDEFSGEVEGASFPLCARTGPARVRKTPIAAGSSPGRPDFSRCTSKMGTCREGPIGVFEEASHSPAMWRPGR